jgi:hypothetical protein
MVKKAPGFNTSGTPLPLLLLALTDYIRHIKKVHYAYVDFVLLY